ncbi:SMAD/FHA domain-containing protein [Pilatotrama ljubarskyi]|nr:SMAD/FHA domain-containing protein [Pilatotrama ljubarskyi]
MTEDPGTRAGIEGGETGSLRLRVTATAIVMKTAAETETEGRVADVPAKTTENATETPGVHSQDRRVDPHKTKPNFAPSGLLAAETKTVKRADGTSTVLKYHEPPEARKPSVGWRLYVFKGKEQVDLLHIHRQSAYLIGRDRAVVDIAVEHPSCSKQHAVIQCTSPPEPGYYVRLDLLPLLPVDRQVQEKNEFGDVKTSVKPFIIDLESTNGTIVNDETIPTSRYYELRLGDVIKFGESAREYVLLSEDAA